jgi:hypothetical protein
VDITAFQTSAWSDEGANAIYGVLRERRDTREREKAEMFQTPEGNVTYMSPG